MWWDVEGGAWIGAEAILMDGVRVGAGAVVTGDVPPHVLAIGAPAQVVRRLGTEAEMQGEIFEAVRGKTRLSHAVVTDCGREM
jgi:serine acetyltransferase